MISLNWMKWLMLKKSLKIKIALSAIILLTTSLLFLGVISFIFVKNSIHQILKIS